mgnify:FL=1
MVTTEQKQADIKAAIEARESEVWGYELNILNFQNLLSEIPDKKPESVLSAETAIEHAMHDFREGIKNRLLSEQVEHQKATLVLQSLKTVLAKIQKHNISKI